MGTLILAQPIAMADQIIQKPYGAFYIVSDKEVSKIFDRNNFGFFVLSPSLNQKPVKVSTRKVKQGGTKKAPLPKGIVYSSTNCMQAPAKPVTTIEPAESIYLRLEKK